MNICFYTDFSISSYTGGIGRTTTVSANAQRRIVEKLIDLNILTEEELDVFNRGRNASSHRSKSTDIITYKKATGFECVIGYLYNNDRERCNYILDYIVGNNL